MQLTADQFRLLSAFEQGQPRTLRDVRNIDCPDQSVRQMAQDLMQFQRHIPCLIKRVAHTADMTSGIRTIEDSVWSLTIDGYVFLMEERQHQRMFAERNQCFRRQDGSEVRYRIRKSRRTADEEAFLKIEIRDKDDEKWQLCAEGKFLGTALQKARQVIENMM